MGTVSKADSNKANAGPDAVAPGLGRGAWLAPPPPPCLALWLKHRENKFRFLGNIWSQAVWGACARLRLFFLRASLGQEVRAWVALGAICGAPEG